MHSACQATPKGRTQLPGMNLYKNDIESAAEGLQTASPTAQLPPRTDTERRTVHRKVSTKHLSTAVSLLNFRPAVPDRIHATIALVAAQLVSLQSDISADLRGSEFEESLPKCGASMA